MWSGTEKGSNKGRMERGEWDKQEEWRLGEQSRCDFRSVLASHSPTALVSALLPHKSQLHGPLVRCSQLCPVPLTPEPVHPRLSPSVSSSHLCPPHFLPPVLCVTAALCTSAASAPAPGPGCLLAANPPHFPAHSAGHRLHIRKTDQGPVKSAARALTLVLCYL